MNPLSESASSQSGTASPPPLTPESFLPETATFRKSQYLLGFTIDALLKRHGVTRVLFVTLTFKRNTRSIEAAQGKLNSLLNAVRKRYGGYLWVLEPHVTGGIHFHLLIPVDFDCHAGTHLEAWSDRFVPLENTSFRSERFGFIGPCTRDTYQRNSMNPALRAENDWWQVAAKAHGFGRVQVAPIYSNADAIRKYMIKQDWRTRPWPFKERKNIQFWRCSQNLRVGNAKFAWATPGARRGRQKLAAWAKGYGCETYEDLPRVLGRQWNRRHYCECILGRDPEPVPSAYHHMRYSDPGFPFQRNPTTWPPQADHQSPPHSPC